MSELDDLSYCDLRTKEVVNCIDGRRMGRIVDILFCSKTGVIRGIVVPLSRRAFFSKNQEMFIPWKCVTKIGEDVIIVNVTMDSSGQLNCKRPSPPPPRDCECDDDCSSQPPPNCNCPPPPPPHGNCCPPPNCGCAPPTGFPDCDRRCEKCMLFDCAYRWVANT